MSTCLICLGSNYRREESLPLARCKLQALFPTICFATEVETEPLHLRNTALFSNQVAMFTTGIEEKEVIRALKQIEFEVGRRPEDKLAERVCLDIDLLVYDDEILKPEDMRRPYIREGVKELNEEIQNYRLTT